MFAHILSYPSMIFHCFYSYFNNIKMWIASPLMAFYEMIVVFLYFFIFSKCFATGRFYLHNHNIICNYALQKNVQITGFCGGGVLGLPGTPRRG